MRLVGYYKIKQGILWQNLGKYNNLSQLIPCVSNTLKKGKEETKEKYPWLEPDDERRNVSDREILDKYVDLDKSCLSDSEKKQVMHMLYRYKDTFSLRDEIGMCLNKEVEIDVTDKSPFFIGPYHVKEEDKTILDRAFKRFCYLGILKEGFSAYLSRVMLISSEVTKDKRVVTDFRHLNLRTARNDLAYTLLKDTFSALGTSRCKVLSVLDSRDAFHFLTHSENSKRCCSILTYFGSTSYLYQRMSMQLNISLSIWQSYINRISDCLQSRKYCEAIMDDLLLLTPTKKLHIAKLEDLLKVLLKFGLKISPKKCQLFRKVLQCMRNTIFIKDSRVCVKSLWSRLEAIQKLKPPTTVKGCRSFVGIVNFFNLFCLEWQKWLKPIYDLTRKSRQFIWEAEQQIAFEEIKSRIIKHPCCIYQTIKIDLICTQTLVNLLQAFFV